jgi:hypothetical protein
LLTSQADATEHLKKKKKPKEQEEDKGNAPARSASISALCQALLISGLLMCSVPERHVFFGPVDIFFLFLSLSFVGRVGGVCSSL